MKSHDNIVPSDGCVWPSVIVPEDVRVPSSAVTVDKSSDWNLTLDTVDLLSISPVCSEKYENCPNDDSRKGVNILCIIKVSTTLKI